MKMLPTPDLRNAGSRWEYMMRMGFPFTTWKFRTSIARAASGPCWKFTYAYPSERLVMRSRQTRMDTTGPIVENNSYSWASVQLGSKSPVYRDVADRFDAAGAVAGGAAVVGAAGVEAILVVLFFCFFKWLVRLCAGERGTSGRPIAPQKRCAASQKQKRKDCSAVIIFIFWRLRRSRLKPFLQGFRFARQAFALGASQ